MIEIQNISKSFNGSPVLDNINLTVEEEETLVIIGPSGSGKTTLLKLLNKLHSPDSGVIKIDDQDINSLNTIELRRRMGYVIQEVGLFPHLSLYENITLIPNILKWDKNKIHKKVNELCKLLNIEDIDLESKYMNEISGGQRQRIGIARALITDPDIILLDEPFGALDPVTRVSVRKEFRRLEKLLKKTMVMVTHDISEALEIGDRICVIDEGRIQQSGTPGELLFEPQNKFVEDFFKHDLLKHQMQLVKISDIFNQLNDINDKDRTVREINMEEDVFSVINDPNIHDFRLRAKHPQQGEKYFDSAELMRVFLSHLSQRIQ